MNRVIQNARKKEKEYLNELFHLLSIPSISTLPEHHEDIHKAASWIAEHMKEIGLENVQLLQNSGNPVVYGDWLHAKGAPTLLIYGHYDVQPPDPLDEWLSPPFVPNVRNDNIYARGADDNKGQFFIHLKSVDSYLETERKLPINVKFIIEGEEELGSANLEYFINKNKSLLNADIALVSDSGSPSPDRISIFYGLKGLLYTEISVQTAKQDMHSGSYGGAVENPIHILSRIISKLHDDKRRITIPGFYDDVVGISEEEKELLENGNRGEQEVKEALGAKKLIGEKGFSSTITRKTRPTLDVNGIWGGFTAEGQKTIIPYKASAKISMRLVPNQDPKKIAGLFESYLKKLTPETTALTFKVLSSGNPVLVERESPYMKAAQEVVKKVFGSPPHLNRTGGSIPAVEVLGRVLGIGSILLGFGLDDDNIHAPNEKLSLEMFHRGLDTSILFLGELASLKK